MKAGLTFTDQAPASSVAETTMDDRAPTELWQELASSQPFQAAIVDAIRVSASGKAPIEFRDELDELGLPMGLDELAMRIAKGDKQALFTFTYELERLGEGWTTTQDTIAVSQLLEGGEQTPTISVRLVESFFERRADQRRDVCELLATLACACDVRVVSSGIERRKLAKKHREELPGVSEHCSAPRSGLPLSEVVETARAELGDDSTEVAILRELSEDPAQTLSYHAIESQFQVSDSRIRQCISSLVDLSLVDTFDGANGRAAELLNAGSAFLEALDEDLARQSELDSFVSEAGNSSIYCRVGPQPGRGGGGGPRDRRHVGTAVEVEHYPRWRDAAVAGCASDGTMRLVDRKETLSDELRQPYWSYDEQHDRVIVGAEYNNPLQWWVSVARALTCYGMFEQALTPERIDGDAGDLAGLLTDDLRILRDGRCLGYLKDADANGEDYADALRKASEELCQLTTAASDAYGEKRNELRGTVLKEALGLAGTVAHLCDLAGIELVREIRLPEFSRRFSNQQRRAALIKTLSKGAAIQSNLGHFAAYRQLFENDEKKRSAAMDVDVDAADPHGKMIGSFVLVGDGVSSLEESLVSGLRNPDDLHEDAPEFDVGVAVRSYTGRPAFAQAITETLDGKNLTPTREAVATMTALTGNPYDAALALNKGLATEDKYPGRTIRADEVRVALRRGLDDSRILPDAAPSVGAIVSGLLTATEPISQTELAERADVSSRSIRTYAPTLEAIGLLSRTGAGYRLQISFGDEGETIVPDPITDTITNHVDLLTEALETIIGVDVYDPEHPIGAALWGDTPVDDLLDTNPKLATWVHIAVALGGPDADAPGRVARFGKTPKQAAITEVAA